jgi:hypothetical protein
MLITIPGPVARAFFEDWTHRVQCIMGPVGSGKTTAALAKAIWACYRQPPSPTDNIRRFRVTVVRSTYRDLWHATIPSLNDIVQRTEANWQGSEGNPATLFVNKRMPDGSITEGELHFRALGDNPLGTLRGYQTSVFLFEEGDLIPWEWIMVANERAGRYPQKAAHGEAWHAGVWITSNAFDVDSEIYRHFVSNPKPGFVHYVQPGGREKGAENVHNLRKGYYDDIVRTADPDRTRRMVDNLYGYSRAGKPVFLEEWSDHLHVAPRRLEPVPGRPVIWGADAGLTPAAALIQQAPSGQWQVLREITYEGGVEGFAREITRVMAGDEWEWLRAAGPDADMLSGAGDPAAMSRSSTDERVWLRELQRLTGFRWRPGRTNLITPRLSAIRRPLTRLIGGQPGLLVDPRCSVLRRAMASGYRFRRIQTAGGATRYDDVPEKNHPDSDLVDALGYALLNGGEFDAAMRRDQASSGRVQTMAGGPETPPTYAPASSRPRFAAGAGVSVDE